MSKFSRIVVLVTALASLFAVMSSTAGAVTWTNTGATTFHATGGPGTLTATRHPGVGSNLSCLDSTATGTVPMDFTSVTGTVTFTSCSLTGTPAHVNCHYILVPLGHTASGTIIDGTASVTCTAFIVGSPTPLCHIEGSTPGQYINPVGTTAGKVTLLSSTSLTVTHSNGTSSCSALLGTTASGPGHLSEQTFTLTGSGATHPFITTD